MKYFFLLICSLLIGSTACKEIILTRQNDSYVFKASIGNLNVNLHPVLSLQHTPTWIKSQNCNYCQLINTDKDQPKNTKAYQKIDGKMYDCSQSCFDKAEDQYGLKCVQTHNKCKVLKDDFETIIQTGKKVVGKLIEINVQAKANDEKFDHFQTVLVEKIILSHDSQTSNNQKIQPSAFIPIGEYAIWGASSLFETSVIAKNSKQDLVIFDGLKQKNLQTQLMSDASPIEIQFEETVTQFTLSQIRLSQKIALNHPQKITDDHQIPILPLQKGFFTLQTQNLLLPKKHFLKLIDHLISTYFSTQNNKCQFKDSKITCENSLTLQKVQFLQLQLILNGISIGFPFQTLLKKCKSKSCDLRVSLTKSETSFAIGTFFLEIFAVEYVSQTQNIKLHRLDNQWNSLYSKQQRYHKENFNILWWMFSSFFYAIYIVLKVVFYLAVFSLAVNLLYRWRKMIEWGGKICEKMKKKRGLEESSELFENEEDLEAKDTAKLIKRFKNRKKVFVEDSNGSMNDEITTQESG